MEVPLTKDELVVEGENASEDPLPKETDQIADKDPSREEGTIEPPELLDDDGWVLVARDSQDDADKREKPPAKRYHLTDIGERIEAFLFVAQLEEYQPKTGFVAEKKGIRRCPKYPWTFMVHICGGYSTKYDEKLEILQFAFHETNIEQVPEADYDESEYMLYYEEPMEGPYRRLTKIGRDEAKRGSYQVAAVVAGFREGILSRRTARDLLHPLYLGQMYNGDNIPEVYIEEVWGGKPPSDIRTVVF